MKVGIIGLGIMGQAMAERLLAAGHTVGVYNRTQEKALPLQAQGATIAASPAELAAESEVVISVVTDPAAVQEIALGKQGVLAGLSEAGVHCDMSTVTPTSAGQVAAAYRARERRFVQAPVLGSKRQIEASTLLVFGGGETADVETCERAWSAFTGRVWHLPTAEQAATLKLACNMLLAHTILGLGQSLVFGAKGGVEPALLLEVLNASAVGSPMVASKGKTLLERNFKANFVVRNMHKDLRLIAEAAQENGTPLPLAALSRELFLAAIQQGYGDEDYSAVVKVLESLAGQS